MELTLLLLPVMTALSVLGYAAAMDSATLHFDSVSVPTEWHEDGYSSEVVMARLADRVREIAHSSGTLKQGRNVQIGKSENFVDELGDAFHMEGAVHALRAVAGYITTRVDGEVVRKGETSELLVRINTRGGRHVTVIQAAPEKDRDGLIARGAEVIVRIVDPYMLAAYYYSVEEGGNDYSRSREMIEVCLSRAPSNELTWVYNLRGIIAHDQKRFADAESDYRHALALDPRFLPSLLNLAELQADQGDYEGAVTRFEAALAADHDRAAVFTAWAETLLGLGKLVEADAKAAQAVAANPRFVEAYRQWGDIALARGMAREAFEHYDRAVGLEPENVLLREKLARLRSSVL